MIYGSVCSGIEAATVAWHPLGWRPAFFSEIDKFPRAVLAHHYPEVPCHGDFTTIQAGDYKPIDLLVGGTPCQDFSVAGLRAGLAGARGRLTIEFLELARRLRPKWLVWENVPGVLSADGGVAFALFLGRLGQLGYGFSYRILDAQHFGVPQRRRRVFVVGYLGDWRRAAAVLFERASLSGHPAPRRETGQSVAGTLGGSSQSGGFRTTDLDNNGAFITEGIPDIAWTLQERDAKGSDSSTKDGHLIPVAFKPAHYTRGKDGAPSEIFPPLSADADKGDQDAVIAFSTKDYGQDAEADMAPTLRGGGHDGSHANGGVMPAMAFALRGRNGGAMPEVSGDGVSALRAASGGSTRDMVATFAIQGAASRENPSSGPDGIGVRGDGSAYTLEARSEVQAIANMHAVRRLTPRECERLQGFPDDFTLVPYRKKPAADGPRYKALGNSMAVPVMAWIGERIARVEAMT